ncbi:MAG TPA: rod shape-determining protein MreC [Sphingomonadaceae bacterium]
MARPADRRRGHSKKAQYSAFTGYLVAAIGAALGAILLIVSLLRPGAFAPLREEATDIVAPAGEAGAAGRSGSLGFVDAISGYFRAGSQNARLREEAQQARIKLAEASALAEENRELKALLKLGQGPDKPIAFARLIGSTSASTRRIAYLSAGRNQGVEPGMPVRAPRGLIGRVLEAGSDSARVLLLTDGASMVPVKRAGDEVVAFAEGRADGTLRLRLINLGINPLKVGDVFVTSGAGGIFRPGVAVAVVSSLTKDGGIGRVLANPAATVYVAVEPQWAPAPDETATPEPQGGQAR